MTPILCPIKPSWYLMVLRCSPWWLNTSINWFEAPLKRINGNNSKTAMRIELQSYDFWIFKQLRYCPPPPQQHVSSNPDSLQPTHNNLPSNDARMVVDVECRHIATHSLDGAERLGHLGVPELDVSRRADANDLAVAARRDLHLHHPARVLSVRHHSTANKEQHIRTKYPGLLSFLSSFNSSRFPSSNPSGSPFSNVSPFPFCNRSHFSSSNPSHALPPPILRTLPPLILHSFPPSIIYAYPPSMLHNFPPPILHTFSLLIQHFPSSDTHRQSKVSLVAY